MTDRIHVQGQGGQVVALDLPLHPDVAKRLQRGALRRVKPDGTLYDEAERPLDAPNLPDSRPAINDVKAQWVGWAVKNGMGVDDAEAATKADLISLYGVGSDTTVGEVDEVQGQPANTDGTPVDVQPGGDAPAVIEPAETTNTEGEQPTDQQ